MFIEERVDKMEKRIEELQREIKRLEACSGEEVLTPEEFAQRSKINKNTVYCWIREGKIKILPNLGTAKRIPMSQFYEREKEESIAVCKKMSKTEQLKEEFLSSIGL